MFAPYRPEPYVDFAEEAPRRNMIAALERVSSQLGREYPLRIGGEFVTTTDKIKSHAPAQKTQVVGLVSKADAGLADKAVRAAAAKFPEWSRTDPMVRARILVKAAAIMRRRLYDMSAWMCYEVSKSWTEAFYDACEAIDFLEFYARQMVRMAEGHSTSPFPGEENEYRYIPLGVCAVIPPWNFPLAICVGMTTAALVTGNTVVLKPASTSPVIAAKFVEIMHEAGLPPGVLNFVPGPGAAAGDTMVEHPLTRLIAFTGSMEVGLGIFEKASKVKPGQNWLKRTVLEMGGKNCIIVDETADLDAAAEGVVLSAFGFQGQKCSACSRLIAHQDIYAKLMDRVVDRAKGITIGHTAAPENHYLGAVIDEPAFKKINEYVAIGKKEGRAVLADMKVPDTGHFISPTIIADVASNARIAQEEIFGPVLGAIKVRDFDEALAVANGTRFGLTGACFSNDRMRLERARHEFHVGNLYLNRKCTGAIVDVQPFGGFNMSGTDSKAGGRDYLNLFMQGKSISERW